MTTSSSADTGLHGFATGTVSDVIKWSDTSGGLSGVGDPGGFLVDSDRFGQSTASLGDIDGDGTIEVAVGANGRAATGEVLLLSLDSDRSIARQLAIPGPGSGFTGTLSAGDGFGLAVASVGDVDGDGVVDLAVGAPNTTVGADTFAGALWILLLQTSGPGDVTVRDSIQITDLPGFPAGAGHYFGGGIARLGDLDGDGGVDLAVGAREENSVVSAGGAVFLIDLAGPTTSSPGSVESALRIGDGTNGFSGALESGEWFGWAIAHLGDLDGDGTTEIAVGAPNDDPVGTGFTNQGSVWILSIDPATRQVVRDRRIAFGFSGFPVVEGETRFFGSTLVRLGDLDGDGVTELLVGESSGSVPGVSGSFGASWIVFLDDSAGVRRFVEIGQGLSGLGSPLDNSDRFGRGASVLGDLDGDGRREIAIGAPLDDDGGTNRGAVYTMSLDGGAAVCTDGVLDPFEECDDGNGFEGDGCSSTCRLEEVVRLSGFPSGGTIDATVDGTLVSVPVIDGASLDIMTEIVAASIRGNASLQARGVTATAAEDGRLIVGGRLLLDTSSDPNLSTTRFDLESNQKIVFFGSLGLGGVFQATIDGVVVTVEGQSGWGTREASEALAAAINADATLMSRGITASSAVNVLTVTNAAGPAVVTSTDPNVGVKAQISIVQSAISDGYPIPRVKNFEPALGHMVVPDIESRSAFGASAVRLGDFDDDGLPEVAVGAPESRGGRGAVFILSPDRDGTLLPNTTSEISDAFGELSGPGNPGGLLSPTDGFGAAVASPGDLDGDEIPDLVVGATQSTSGRGALYVLFMNTDKTVRSFQRISATEGGFTGALDAGDEFGAALGSPGDVDGDGVPDLLVGAPGDDDGGLDSGAAWILRMNASGTVKSHAKIGGADLPSELGAFDEFGRAVVGLGDLDRDGGVEIAVSAPGVDGQLPDAGAVYVLFLDASESFLRFEKISPEDGILFPVSLVSIPPQARIGTSLAFLPDADDGTTRGTLAIGAESYPNPACAPFDYPEGACPPAPSFLGTGGIVFVPLEIDGSVRGANLLQNTRGLSLGAVVPVDLGDEESNGLGSAIAPIGDLDGDDVLDLFVGSALGTRPGATLPLEAGNGFFFSMQGADSTVFADLIVDVSGPVSDPTAVLGEPSDDPDELRGAFAFTPTQATMGPGTSMTLQFVDNVIRGSGTPDADFCVYVGTASSPAAGNFVYVGPATVEVSEDGDNWVTTAATTEQTCPVAVDLDSAGFNATDAIRFVRLTGQTHALGSGATSSARIDAIESLTTRSMVRDSDFDGLPDGLDNCPFLHNPGQVDGESDGVGDVCDNCPVDFNPDQFDDDDNGVGNVCEPGILRLQPIGDAAMPEWLLSVRCPGGSPLFSVGAGIVIPSVYTAPVVFTADANVNVITQILPGTGGPGTRSDTLYLDLGPNMCPALTEIPLGTLTVGPDPLGTFADAYLTRQGLTFPTVTEEQLIAARSAPCVGACPPPPPPGSDPTVEVVLGPSPGQIPGSVTEYDLCFRYDDLMHRIAIGVGLPQGFSDPMAMNTISLQGCTAAASTHNGGIARRSCGSGVLPGVATGLDPGGQPISFVIDPSTSPAPGLEEDVFYVVLEGNLVAPAGSQTLSYGIEEQLNCVGRITLSSPVSGSLNLTDLGLELLPYHDDVPTAYLTAIGQAGLENSDLTSLLNAPPDQDGDTIQDGADRCVWTADVTNADSGALLGTAPSVDGIGDACQCGDVDGTGAIFGPPTETDLERLWDHVLGIAIDPVVEAQGSVVGGIEVDIRDIAQLQRAIAGLDAPLAGVCANAVPPSPPPPAE